MLLKAYRLGKPLILYLTYFCMVCGMIMAMLDSNSIFSSFGFKMGTVGAFAFWITFFALKFDWFEDAEFISRRVILWIGLLASALLLVLQAYIRFSYGYSGLMFMPHLLPTYAYLESYQSYLIIARYVLIGILGFSFFGMVFAEGDTVGYNFVEVTTYFTDSGFAYNQTVSDIKNAVWGYIVVGLATTIVPFLISMNPLMILALGFFLLRLLKHRNKKAVWIKRAVIWSVCLIAMVLLIAANRGLLPATDCNANLGYQLETTEDGEEYYDIKAVLNEAVATHITIPETYKGKPVRVTDREVFAHCDQIRWVKAPLKMVAHFPQAEELILTSGTDALVLPRSILKRVEIAYEATSIGYQGFRYFTHLEEVILPNTIKVIDAEAFYGCTALKSINLPNGLEQIKDYAFTDCESLRAIEIPQTVTELGAMAFCRCSSLTSVNIPEGLTVLKNSVFNGCALTSIVIPQSVTEIGASAFAGCKSLTSVTLGSKVVTIRDNAFSSCDTLTRVILPRSVQRVSFWAFYRLPTVICYAGTAAEWSEVSRESDTGIADPGQFPLTVKYYSDVRAEGCWYYGANGEPLEW